MRHRNLNFLQTVAHPVMEALKGRRLFTLGGLDPTFGNGGVVTDKSSSTADSVLALPDGDTLAAGTSDLLNINTPDQVYLRRYASNGTVDKSFGVGNVVVAEHGDVAGLAEDSSGRILLAIATDTASLNVPAYRIFRFEADGKLDTSFANHGTLVINTPGVSLDQMGVGDKARMVLDLSIYTTTATGTTTTEELARYTPLGTLDDSFGTKGVQPISYDGSCIAFQPDGKIILGAGVSNLMPGGYFDEPSVVRYNANGSVDQSFGVHGLAKSNVPVPIPNSPVWSDLLPVVDTDVITLVPGGDIAITGQEGEGGGDIHAAPANSHLYLAEFTARGAVNNSFGKGGFTETDIDPATPDGSGAKEIAPGNLTAEANGALIVSGDYIQQFSFGTGDKENLFIAQYSAQGQPNLHFASGGVALAPLPVESTYPLSTAPSFAGGDLTLALVDDDSGGFFLARYTAVKTATVSGMVFNDLDGDGIRQSNEPGLAGAVVFADVTNVGYYVLGDQITTTDSSGHFTLPGLPSATYEIRVKPEGGYRQTFPANKGGMQVTLQSGDLLGNLDFGEQYTK